MLETGKPDLEFARQFADAVRLVEKDARRDPGPIGPADRTTVAQTRRRVPINPTASSRAFRHRGVPFGRSFFPGRDAG
jgi:hypothetical protein